MAAPVGEVGGGSMGTLVGGRGVMRARSVAGETAQSDVRAAEGIQ